MIDGMQSNNGITGLLLHPAGKDLFESPLFYLAIYPRDVETKKVLSFGSALFFALFAGISFALIARGVRVIIRSAKRVIRDYELDKPPVQDHQDVI